MTNHLLRALLFITLAIIVFNRDLSAAPVSRVVLPDGEIVLPGIIFSPPIHWKLFQDAINNDTVILGFSQGDDFFTLYVQKKTGLNMHSIFANDVTVENGPLSDRRGPFRWQRMLTSKRRAQTLYISSFLTEWRGYTYYGYSRSSSKASAEAAVNSFLTNVRVQVSGEWSLTAPDYTGKKYYFGFGDRLGGEMGNEVKYDINHTHDIFTKDIGGDYIGDKLIGTSHQSIVDEWQKIGRQITPSDMYVQYSSGHGSSEGLMAGVSYDEIRDNALSLPAKEVIVFIMACYSGNLVSSFDERKSDWQDWGKQGRTLMVLASSRPEESSLTGPGTDPDQPNGPDGSAGSAFGHALWKSLIGYSDGYVDGVKDGFISLGEIQTYTTDYVQKITGGYQNPISTGVYKSNLIMNRVPSAKFLATLTAGSSEQLSDQQVEALIRRLDRELSVH